jgi:hypothetical protein
MLQVGKLQIENCQLQIANWKRMERIEWNRAFLRNFGDADDGVERKLKCIGAIKTGGVRSAVICELPGPGGVRNIGRYILPCCCQFRIGRGLNNIRAIRTSRLKARG